MNRTEMTLGSLWSRGSDLPRGWDQGKWSRKHRELFWEEVFPRRWRCREGTKGPPGQVQGPYLLVSCMLCVLAQQTPTAVPPNHECPEVHGHGPECGCSSTVHMGLEKSHVDAGSVQG